MTKDLDGGGERKGRHAAARFHPFCPTARSLLLTALRFSLYQIRYESPKAQWYGTCVRADDQSSGIDTNDLTCVPAA